MDEESATTVALQFLLRGRWDNTAIVLHCACMPWMCGKVHRVEDTKIVLCFSRSLVCVLW